MSYEGQWAEIPVGTAGLLSDMPSSEIPHTSLIRATNIDYSPGYIQKAPGSIRYNTTVFTGGLVGLLDYWLDGITQRTLVATSDGKIWKDKGDRTFSTMTPVQTGLGTLDGRCTFVIGGNEIAGNPKKVFFFNGGTQQIQVLSGDGVLMSKIALPASDWPNATPSVNANSYYPSFGLIHRARLWAFMKSTAYASSTSNHEDFSTPANILINLVGPGDGGDIIGAFVYKGTMLVFKQGDVCYRLIDTDSSAANWYFSKFSEGFSIANWHANLQVLDDLITMNSTGTLTSYKATQAYGNFEQGDLFKAARVSQFYKQRTTPSAVTFAQATYYPERGRAYFTSRSGYKTYNDEMIVYDVSNPEAPKFSLWTHFQADCLAMRRDINNIQRPIYGGTDGYMYLADRETRSVNGVAYTAEFQTPYMDFRHLDPTLSEKQKNFQVLSVTFTPDGNHSLSVDVWIDGKFSETVTAAQTIDTNYLGAFKLGTSKLGSEDEQTVFVPIHGTGRRISLRCYNGNALESFKVSKISIGFRISGNDSTRLIP